MGIGDWGLGGVGWGGGGKGRGMGVGELAPTPQSPIPNPQSPIPNPQNIFNEKFNLGKNTYFDYIKFNL